MKTFLAVSFLFSNLLFTSCYCKKDTTDASNKAKIEAECPKDLMCTMDFRLLSIQVVDAKGNPYLLDSYKTLVDGKEMKLTQNSQQPIDPKNFQGFYVVADDSNMQTFGKSGRVLTFVGLKGGRDVVKHQITVGHDCCHIQLKSGSLKAIVR